MTTRRIRTICFVFVCCNSIFSSFCQESNFSSGMFAGENCILATDTNVWAVQTNPALLAYCGQTEVGAAYSTNYLATDMVCSRINACTRMKQLTTAVSATIFGNTHFRESCFSGSIARKLNFYNALAVKSTITRQFQEEYTPKLSVYPEFAYFGEQKKLSYGIHIVNPLRLFRQSSRAIFVTKLIVNYRINDIVYCSGMFSQKTDVAPTVSLGIGAKPSKYLQAGISYSTHETPVTLLLQIPLERIQCYYETAYNYYLGMTHSMGLLIKW